MVNIINDKSRINYLQKNNLICIFVFLTKLSLWRSPRSVNYGLIMIKTINRVIITTAMCTYKNQQ